MENIDQVLNGTSIVSVVMRMIAYETVPEMRDSLNQNFPSEIRFVGEDAYAGIVNFIKDVIERGAMSVSKERLFIVGHQGSGKTSLAHSLRCGAGFDIV